MAVSCLIVGVALIGVSVAMKIDDSDLKIEFYQLWVSIPILLFGFFAIINVCFPKKQLSIIFVVLSFAMFVITLAGAFGAGFYYWKDGWRRTRISFSNDRCTDNNNTGCKCTDTLIPVNFKDCDDVETQIALIIAEIVLCSIAFIVTLIGLFVSFMSICCAPWMYFEMYDPAYDPDIGNARPPPPTSDNIYDNPGNLNKGFTEQPPTYYY